jgi:hypothetical protein
MSSNSTDFANGLHSYGPSITGHFDFTPLFENSTLSIVPLTLLLLDARPNVPKWLTGNTPSTLTRLSGSQLNLFITETAFKAAALRYHPYPANRWQQV